MLLPQVSASRSARTGTRVPSNLMLPPRVSAVLTSTSLSSLGMVIVVTRLSDFYAPIDCSVSACGCHVRESTLAYRSSLRLSFHHDRQSPLCHPCGHRRCACGG